jgi:hypothetical protein
MVDDTHVKMDYYAYAYSAMQYGIVFWRCSSAVLNSVFVAQKRCIRAMSGERYWAVLNSVFVAQKRCIRAVSGERYWPGPIPFCSARPLVEKLNLLPVFSFFAANLQVC